MENKSSKQPHAPRLGRLKNGGIPCDLATLPRCTAKAKSTGQRCKQPAMRNGKCYLHGGKSPGAPLGNHNAFKHGNYCKEALEFKRRISEMLRESKRTIAPLLEER